MLSRYARAALAPAMVVTMGAVALTVPQTTMIVPEAQNDALPVVYVDQNTIEPTAFEQDLSNITTIITVLGGAALAIVGILSALATAEVVDIPALNMNNSSGDADSSGSTLPDTTPGGGITPAPDTTDPSPAPNPAPELSQDKMAKMVFDRINDYRVEQGLRPLRWDPTLFSSAKDHSAWMDDTDTFEHTTANVSENIEWDTHQPQGDGPRTAFYKWLHSPTHHANMVDTRLTRGAVGVRRGDYTDPVTGNYFPVVYWVTFQAK